MTTVQSASVRARVVLTGLVQGVGFRPFVHRLASRWNLAGFVRNDAGVVCVEIEGGTEAVTGFVREVQRTLPPRAVVEDVRVTEIPAIGDTRFTIGDSQDGAPRHPSVAPDIAVCANCLDELFDVRGRRYHHPFITCVDCGPRLSIIRSLPYDRSTTTMTAFPLCPRCAAEYGDPADRRFHAEPICCPACGPRLVLRNVEGTPVPDDPVETAACALLAGETVAVKGVGGYHLVVDATNDEAVGRLRTRKRRPHQPFAVMVKDLTTAHRIAVLDGTAERLLGSYRAPIVLLDRRPDAPISRAVAPDSTRVGLMVPHTPVQHLLLRRVDRPLVCTSGNLHGEPIAFEEAPARARLDRVADRFLTHDRDIEIGLDDSVVALALGRELVVRRARGYVPEPVSLPVAAVHPVLALGNHVKSTFCLVDGDRSYLSQHLGNLESYEALLAYRRNVAHFTRLLGIQPRIVAHDLHPGSVATADAFAADTTQRVAVQHHHAHIASCLVENGMVGPVIGVAFDGLGMGTDGTLWGGEFLVADLVGFQRAAHLEGVPMPGGDAAVREPWRMAASWLVHSVDRADRTRLAVARRHESAWDTVERMAVSGARSPRTSSAGRLFDAVAAIVGVRDLTSYEGQAATNLEQLADTAEQGTYPVELAGSAPLVVRASDLVRAVVADLTAGAPPTVVSRRFHNGLADAVIATCDHIRGTTGLSTVALSGGVFQNTLLLARVVAGLGGLGFTVLRHSRVPVNDGGVSLGQAAVAAARSALHGASADCVDLAAVP